jgi:hypothetical protein
MKRRSPSGSGERAAVNDSESLRAAKAAFDRAVAAFHEAVTSQDVERVALAVAEVGFANARVAAVEHRRMGAPSPPQGALEAFDAAFASAESAAATASRWAAEYAVTHALAEKANARGIGDAMHDAASKALSGLRDSLAGLIALQTRMANNAESRALRPRSEEEDKEVKRLLASVADDFRRLRVDYDPSTMVGLVLALGAFINPVIGTPEAIETIVGMNRPDLRGDAFKDIRAFLDAVALEPCPPNTLRVAVVWHGGTHYIEMPLTGGAKLN